MCHEANLWCNFSMWYAALEAIYLLVVASDEYRCRWHIKLRSIDVRSHVPLRSRVQILQILLVADVLIYLCVHLSTFVPSSHSKSLKFVESQKHMYRDVYVADAFICVVWVCFCRLCHRLSRSSNYPNSLCSFSLG